MRIFKRFRTATRLPKLTIPVEPFTSPNIKVSVTDAAPLKRAPLSAWRLSQPGRRACHTAFSPCTDQPAPLPWSP